MPAQAPLQPEKPNSIFELLTSTDVDSFALEASLDELNRHRRDEDYFEGHIFGADGHSFRVKLRTNGLFRCQNAAYPPLKVKFSKKEMVAMGLDTVNTVKLTLPFYDNAYGEELLIREYLTYRMWEKISPYHVRARLVHLTLKDASSGKTHPLYCLVTEDKQETANRHGGALVESYGLSADRFDGQQLALVAFFQYMIGNADWELEGFHNVRLMQVPNREKLEVIPFDFDFSLLVGADYAQPTDPSKRDKRREFQLKGLYEQDVQAAIAKLEAARADLTAICSHPLLSKRAAANMVKCLDRFYDNLPDCKEISCLKEKVEAGK